MSKYVYKTVYEEFTGQKPPEPKLNKSKPKRGCGHPYRMRINDTNNTDNNEDDFGNKQSYHEKIVRPQKQGVRTQHQRQYTPSNNFNTTWNDKPNEFVEKNINTPKVSYKKRRCFNIFR